MYTFDDDGDSLTLRPEATASMVRAGITHGLFHNDAESRLKQAGVRYIWSTDSVSHESNIIPLSGILKDAVSRLP